VKETASHCSASGSVEDFKFLLQGVTVEDESPEGVYKNEVDKWLNSHSQWVILFGATGGRGNWVESHVVRVEFRMGLDMSIGVFSWREWAI